jgi:hypothetical protein
MPTYVVTSPDGKEFEITAPEGATQEQVLAYAQQNFKAAEPAQRSLGSDILRQVGLTGRAAVTGALSLPALAADPLANLVNMAAGKTIMTPPSQGIQNLMTAAGVPAPETGLERAVQTGASAMAGIAPQAALAKVTPALAPLGQNLLQQTAAAGAGGTAAQVASDAVQEATDNPLASIVAGLAAGTVAGSLGAKTATSLSQKRQPLVTLDEIKKRAQQSYSTMENLGVQVKPKSILDTFDNIESKLVKENFNPKLDTHKPVAQVLEQIRTMVGQQRVPFTRLEQMRSALVDLKNSKEPATRKYAGQAVAELDNYISNLGAKDIIAGKANVGEAVKAVQTARKDWRNLSRATVIEDALNVAEAKALDPKASEGELIRRQLINLASNKDKMRVFTERERNAIKSVASGPVADPLLSLLARFNPERSQLVTAGTAFAAGTNPALAIGVSGTGFAADKLQGMLRQRAANRLISDIAQGSLPTLPPNMAWRGLLSGGMVQGEQ